MQKHVFKIIFVVSFFTSVSLYATTFTLTATTTQTNGVTLTISPPYKYEATIVETLDPSACFDVHTPTPLPADPSKYQNVAKVNSGFGSPSFPVQDYNAPDGINICYLLLGRGQVEAKAIGMKVVNWPANTTTTVGFNATRDLYDGVGLKLNPAITVFSTLYVAPLEDNNCPDVGEPFSNQGRYQIVMPESFNGQYYFDTNAPLAIDLCYFLLSNTDQKCIAKTVGFRLP